jgi:uncharacterized membrane protein
VGVRQISNQQREWLSQELEFWRGEGFVNAAQTDRIRDCYETIGASGARQHSRARFALKGISALLVGLAALLVVGYNWDQLHWVLKLVLIFAGVAGTHALAFYLRYVAGAQRVSEVVFFLGCLFYGAGIWLVAQVFHLDSHYPDGVWWWALGVMPLAIVLDTLLLHALFVGLLALWAGMEVTGFSHLSPWWAWNWWPNGVYSLPILAVPGLIWAYRRGSAAAVGLYVPLLAWWVVLQAIGWDLEWQSIYLIGTMGAMFFIVAENHRRGSRMAIPYRLYGTLMVGGALIPPSFYDFHKELRRSSMHDSVAPTMAMLVLLLVVASVLLSCALLLRPLGERVGQPPLARLQEMFRRLRVPLALVLAMAAMAVLGFAPDGALPATIIANAAMIGFALWLMHLGLRDERGRLFAAGVLYFLAWTIFRYIDLFGEHGGMLGAALMFFLCGAALWAVASFWGKRKEVRHA